jgi:hypothetical protein
MVRTVMQLQKNSSSRVVNGEANRMAAFGMLRLDKRRAAVNGANE